MRQYGFFPRYLFTKFHPHAKINFSLVRFRRTAAEMFFPKPHTSRRIQCKPKPHTPKPATIDVQQGSTLDAVKKELANLGLAGQEYDKPGLNCKRL